MTFIKTHWPKLLALAFWGALIFAAQRYAAANDLGPVELFAALESTLTERWYSPLLYILLYLIRPLVLFPASVLTVLGGALFGYGLGFIYALIAGTLSALFPYAVGRWLSGDVSDVADETFKPSRFDRLRQFTGMLKRRPFQSVLTMRLLYLPYDGVSLLAGSLKIPLVTFFIATSIGNIGGVLAYVGVGASLEGDLAQGDIRLNPWTLVISAIILVASFALSRYLRQRDDVSDELAGNV